MKLLSSILAAGAIIALWLLFAPSEFGGRTGYVVVHGESMEPELRGGDLAVVRSASEYRPGDIVTYRHPELGTVIHRIVRAEGARFVLQGDNNDWVDGYMPVEQEIAGELWFNIPGVGTYFEHARHPMMLAMLFLMVGAIIMLPTGQRRTQHPVARKLPTLVGPQGRDLLGLLAVFALGAGLLGALAFSRPAERQVSRELPYEHHGAFSYSAPAPDGIYDAPEVTSGEPIFRELIDSFDVRFDYWVDASAPVEGSGTASLTAELRADNGWSREIELAPATPFDGAETSLSGTVDLAQIQRMIDRVERTSGIDFRQYRLVITPRVEFEGAIAGQPVDEPFAPVLEFRMDSQQLALVEPSTNGAGMLAPAFGSLVTRATTETNTIAIGPAQVEVARARQISIVALLAVALAFGALLLATLQTSGRSDAEQLRARYAGRLVRLRSEIGHPSDEPVEVYSRADFERLLQHHAGPIFEDGPTFIIHHEGRRYRLRTVPVYSEGDDAGVSSRVPHHTPSRSRQAVAQLLFTRRQRERRA